MSSQGKRAAGAAAVYATTDALVKGVNFLLIPLYTAALSQGEYGALAILLSGITLSYHLLGLGLNSGVMRFYYQFEDRAERASFYGTMWITLIATSGAFLVAAWAVAAWVMDGAIGGVRVDPHLQLALLAAFFHVAFRTMVTGLLRVTGRAWSFAGFGVFTVSMTLGLSYLYVGVQDGGLEGALRALVHANALAALVSVPLMLPFVRLSFSFSHVGRALRYGGPLVPHNVSHWLLGLSDRLIVGHFLGAATVGVYHLARQVGSALQVLLTGINSAVIPYYAKAGKQGGDTRGLARLATYYIAAATMLAVAIIAVGPSLIRLLTPASYHSAITLIPWTVGGVLILGLYYVPMNFLTLTMGRTGGVPVVTLAAGSAVVVLNVILVPRFGILAAAMTMVLGYALLLLGVAQLTRRVQEAPAVGYEWRPIIEILLWGSLVAVVSGVANGVSPVSGIGLGFAVWVAGGLVLWARLSRLIHRLDAGAVSEGLSA